LRTPSRFDLSHLAGGRSASPFRQCCSRAPPPFTEKLATYRVRMRAGTIEVDPHPLPPGTAIRVEDFPEVLR
jgi:hypothetical protein